MKTRLINIKLCGFKSINEPIELQFANKTLDKHFFEQSNVKAIYGTNGVGKSAIALALDIYKKTILNDKFLTVESANGYLEKIINNQNKNAYIDLYFALFDGKNISIFHHSIGYKLVDKELLIDYEKLLFVNGMTWGNQSNEEIVYSVKNGQIEQLFDVSDEYAQEIKNSSANLLDSSSLLIKCIQAQKKVSKTAINDLKMMVFTNSLLVFVAFLNVFINNEDSNRANSNKFKMAFDLIKESDSKALDDKGDLLFYDDVAVINEKNVETYRALTNRITEFIRIFKPNLVEIKVETVPVDSVGNVVCKRKLIYDNGAEVYSQYESSGIKRLIKMFPILSSQSLAGVVFIDEFDANIHDVYLCKLIEYFIDYSDAQLIFTTHNLGPMEVLGNSDLKHTIDFINGSKITSWRKNGNYSVVNVYRNGAIPNCPFNISPADFVGVFEEK